MRLEKVREHKKSILEEVSSDGASMILWQTGAWQADASTLVTRNSAGASGGVDATEPGAKLVRAEVATGKALASIPVEWLPSSVHLFPDEERLVFSLRPNHFENFAIRFWEFAKNQTTPCLDGADAVEIHDATPLSAEELVAMRGSGSRIPHQLVRMDARDCSVVEVLPADPEDDAVTFGGGGLLLSPDRRLLAYSVRGCPLIRDVRNMSAVHRFDGAEEWGYWKVRFMPDSQSLAVLLYKQDRQSNSRQYGRCLRVCDVADGGIVRELDIGAVSSLGELAVSPDGKLAAVSHNNLTDRVFRAQQKQPIVVIYDLENGAELTRQEFPRGPDDGSYGLARVEFTGDGQYLLTSTGDTQVWMIVQSDHRIKKRYGPEADKSGGNAGPD